MRFEWKGWKKLYSTRLFIIGAVIMVLSLFCSKSEPTKSNNPSQPQDAVKTLNLDPSRADSVAFGDRFGISFPAGAVSSPTNMEARELNTESNASLYASAELLSPAYILTPHGQVLQEPARVEFDLSQIQLPSGLTADSLDIFTYDGETFESQNARVEGTRLVCDLRHFSSIFVRMKAGGSFFGGGASDIIDTKLHVYRQQGYLVVA
jgi:hypothetical protein